jgi:putative protein kinase ArgK-like GTPase of G3E family
MKDSIHAIQYYETSALRGEGLKDLIKELKNKITINKTSSNENSNDNEKGNHCCK